MAISRRQFITLTGAATLSIASGHAFGQPSKGRVVVIGGGFGGATAARYIRKLDPAIDVTLLEPNPHYVTCPMGNGMMAGFVELKSITHGYGVLRDGYGVKVIHDRAVDIDPVAKTVRLQGGDLLAYDRLVVSPGIDFRWHEIEGYDQSASELMPHAWRGGRQIQLLKKQLQAMPDGGVVVVTSPKPPYRCPPGPYERASLMAYYLKQYKPHCKILIMDAKPAFPKSHLFERGWEALYPGMVQWVSSDNGGEIIEVRAEEGVLISRDGEAIKADVASVIPPQQAAEIARIADLVDSSGWCPVEPRAFESTRHANIHVIGDSAIITPMPKSGFAANSQAKVVALAITAYLNGDAPGEPSLINTCFSFIAPDHAVSISGVYQLGEQGLEGVRGSGGRTFFSGDVAAEARIAKSWYKNIIADTFG
ncbi:MAG: NAD(P)/FAD-dependent oxidoreductase [Gammaproteobacteria bacterium]|nr:NAD(P)/FAD-dependent oxidoreductase [Gammaproteobacteria bacterium]MCF6230790.1 NAD(P)/FAD-dependent oxidoreductase [Gammaproteobacteria bacterium]